MVCTRACPAPACRQPCRAMHVSPHCRLFYCNITAAGLAALLAGVRASRSRLEALRCVHVQLGAWLWVCVQHFIRAITLLTRSLHMNPLGDEGAAMLADWLATSPPLQTLG